jgi:hypothetical protein
MVKPSSLLLIALVFVATALGHSRAAGAPVFSAKAQATPHELEILGGVASTLDHYRLRPRIGAVVERDGYPGAGHFAKEVVEESTAAWSRLHGDWMNIGRRATDTRRTRRGRTSAGPACP